MRRPSDGRPRPDPVITAPTDPIVRVVLACGCGSDLWYYRGQTSHEGAAIGHEFIGVVDQVGAEVRTLAAGDFVVAPFASSDNTCPHCQARSGSSPSAAMRRARR
jgi:threonine dehydrogenase-like Zn-dependent dehydrogenase